jgi:hypothetical protein
VPTIPGLQLVKKTAHAEPVTSTMLTSSKYDIKLSVPHAGAPIPSPPMPRPRNRIIHRKAIEGSTGEDIEVLLGYKRSWPSRYCEGLEAEKERTTFYRRTKEYEAALVLYQRVRVAYTLRNARTGVWSDEMEPDLVGIFVEKVPPRSLPLHFEPNPYLIDNTEFASPDIYVVRRGQFRRIWRNAVSVGVSLR